MLYRNRNAMLNKELNSRPQKKEEEEEEEDNLILPWIQEIDYVLLFHYQYRLQSENKK